MGKKIVKKHKKISGSKEAMARHFVGTILALAIIFGGYLVIPHPKEVHSSVGQPELSTKLNLLQNTATAEAKPTPTPNPIPINFGREVKVPVIYYHYIGKNPNPADKLRDNLSVDPEIFEQQMDYIAKSGFTTITYDTLYAALKGQTPLPAKPIIISFDDGYVDFYVNAFPILRKYNLKATQFIPTGLIGSSYYLHWEQIKEMDKSGLITFQAHTVVHANLPTMSDAEALNQMVESKQTLESELGKPINFMAYPYGISNEKTWQEASQAGYIGAAGTWGGDIESEGNVYDMPRIKIPGGISLEDFEKKI